MASHFFKQNDEMRNFFCYYTAVPFSRQFYSFLDRQMILLIKQGTGVSPSPQFTIAPNWSGPMYEVDKVSKLNFMLGICDTTGYDISFCWSSLSGKQISIDDENFDEADLDCWIEGLNAEQYYHDLALYGKKKPPFKIGKLPFELEIRDYYYSMHVYVTTKNPDAFEEIKHSIDNCIAIFNELADSRALGQKKGPILQAVHNWQTSLLNDNRIQLYLDAASPEILKKLIQELTRFNMVTKVEMDLVE